MYDCQLSEILVERNENTPFPMSHGQDLIIARISRPVSCPDDIVSRSIQRINGSTPDTGIEQKFHEADSRGSGSIRSWPTSR